MKSREELWLILFNFSFGAQWQVFRIHFIKEDILRKVMVMEVIERVMEVIEGVMEVIEGVMEVIREDTIK